jgi:diguanylate cyclase (GGDEF)-like protein
VIFKKMTKLNPFQLSVELDPDILEPLGQVQRVCVVAAGLIASVVLIAWFVPPLARVLPAGWNVMQANTALVALASAWSIALSLPKRGYRQCVTSQLLSVFVGLLAGGTLAEYALHIALPIDRLLPVRWYAVTPGRMAPQTATCFLLLACVMFLLRKRKQTSATFADCAVCALCIMVLLNGAGYLYGAIRLFGISSTIRTAPTTLICLMLLTFVAFGRRAENGVCGILLGTGIGSRIARIAFPVALVIPFALEAARIVFVRSQLMTLDYAAAIVTALEVPLAFAVILFLAWYIDSLEKEIRELSLRDELTQLYNRRGFYLLAEQALRLAQRAQMPFSVLFVDLDRLKHINDTLGHETGSGFIQDVAQMLQEQVQHNDVVGRIGGDEFVIAGEMSGAAVAAMAERLASAAAERNAQAGQAYAFAFSIGYATWQETTPESLDDMVHRADVAMYQRKRAK